jgi:hypothetical protein
MPFGRNWQEGQSDTDITRMTTFIQTSSRFNQGLAFVSAGQKQKIDSVRPVIVTLLALRKIQRMSGFLPIHFPAAPGEMGGQRTPRKRASSVADELPEMIIIVQQSVQSICTFRDGTTRNETDENGNGSEQIVVLHLRLRLKMQVPLPEAMSDFRLSNGARSFCFCGDGSYRQKYFKALK